MEAELLHAGNGQTDRQTDRQTDMTKLRGASHNIANAPIKLIAAKVTGKFHHISSQALDYFSVS
jgi:hypothetical protein